MTKVVSNQQVQNANIVEKKPVNKMSCLELGRRIVAGGAIITALASAVAVVACTALLMTTPALLSVLAIKVVILTGAALLAVAVITALALILTKEKKVSQSQKQQMLIDEMNKKAEVEKELLRNEIEALKGKIENAPVVKEVVIKKEDNQERIGQLDKQIKDLFAEKDDLTIKLIAKEKKEKLDEVGLNAVKKDLENTKKDQALEVQNMKNRLEEVRQEIEVKENQLKEEVAKKDQAFQDANAVAKDLDNQLKEVRLNLEEEQKKNLKFEKDFVEIKKEAKEKKALLKEEIEKKEQAYQDANAIAKDLNDRLKATNQALNDAEENHRKFYEDYKAKDNVHKQELDKINQDLISMNEKSFNFERQLGEANKLLKNARLKNATIDDEKTEALSEVKRLNEELGKAIKLTENKENQIRKLNNELKLAEDKITKFEEELDISKIQEDVLKKAIEFKPEIVIEKEKTKTNKSKNVTNNNS